MKTETYNISEGQFLDQLEPFKSKGLPTDSVIHKELTGCGATTLELEFDRNSIIIEPNLPVINGKCKKKNGNKRNSKVVLGVQDAVTVEDIKSYVKTCKGNKKILTTPEGFEKVIEAIGPSVYNDYFLMFDECEKAIQDIIYRKRIIDPMKHFFCFKNKTFISATPILPSDPRFQSFTNIYIKPSFNYQHKIKVFTTNNIAYQLKTILDNYTAMNTDEDRKCFIFLKSTQRIKNIIRGLKLEDHAVYCSEKSAKDLKRKDMINAYSNLNHKFAKYNFLTSRYFSAVDIDYTNYACDPIIIMISDPLAFKHTVIDPDTEALQIIGRFRQPEEEDGKPKIVVSKDIYHLSNFNEKLTSYNKQTIEEILKDKQRLHKLNRSFVPVSNDHYFNAFKSNILDLEGFSYFYRDGSTNYYRVDYWINSERVQACYKTATSLLWKYRASERFDLHAESDYKRFFLTDEQLLEISDHTAPTKINDFVSRRLREIMEEKMEASYREFNIELLRFSFPKQMAVIDKFTLSKAAQCDYHVDKIKKFKDDLTTNRNLIQLKATAKKRFEKIGYTTEEIVTILTAAIAEVNVKGFTPDVKLLKKIAILSKRQNINKDLNGVWQKGYKILQFIID